MCPLQSTNGFKRKESHGVYELCLFVHNRIDTIMVDEIMNNPNLTISQKQSGDLMWFRRAQMVTIQTEGNFYFV